MSLFPCPTAEAFLWKNWKSLRSQLLLTLLQLIVFLGILFAFLYSTDTRITLPRTLHDPQNEDTLTSYFTGENEDVLLYAPSTSFLDDLMDKVRIDLSMPIERLASFRNEEEMFAELEAKSNTRSFAVLFEKYPLNDSSGKNNFTYSISSTSTDVSTLQKYLNDREEVGIKEFDEYIRSGFFILQRTIDKNFIEIFARRNIPIEIEILPFPTAEIEVTNGTRTENFGLLFYIFFSALLITVLIVPLVEEKELGVKQFFPIITKYDYLNGITYFLVRFWIFAVYAIVSLMFGFTYYALGIVPFVYGFVLFSLYTISALCFGFFVSVFFSSVLYAKIVGIFFLLIPAVLYILEIELLKLISFYIFNSSVFLEGLVVFQVFTNKHRPFTLESLCINARPDLFKLISIFAMLIIHCLVYLFLYWYLSHVRPGKYGIRKPYDFFLKTSYWRNDDKSNNRDEENPQDLNTVIQTEKLCKTFRSGLKEDKKVVNDLDLNIEDKKVTVLLGHNGAGKTTTMNMIVGLIPKTSGNITVCNETDPAKYKHLIGYCPQQNIFMPYLTCEEHLRFFAKLRGLNEEQAQQQAKFLLQQLKLQDKMNEEARNLSGGMKRRLSLGIAISGNTRVAILDEPSSGLDPESRRELWNAILNLRKRQAILVTTHHMDEAEILGDNVIILSNGTLIKSGDTLKLKRDLGCGYILKLFTNKKFKKSSFIEIFTKYIPDYKIKSDVYPNLCISLPYNYQHKYKVLLEHLEELMDELGISSISITDTNMEEVFLNSEQADEVDGSFTQNLSKIPRGNIPYIALDKDPAKDTQIIMNQMCAIFYKKFVYIRREWIYALLMFLIPLVMGAATMLTINFKRESRNLNSLLLDLNHIPGGKVYVSIPSEFHTFERYLLKEIEKMNAVAISVDENTSLQEELIRLQQENIADFYDSVIGALKMYRNPNTGSATIRILYSGNIIHSSVIMLNLIDNVILKEEEGGNSFTNIETLNTPTFRIYDISPAKLEYYNIFVPIGWIIYMLFYVSLPFIENKTEFRKLQPVPRGVYWISCLIFDIFVHTIICFLALIIQVIFSKMEIFNMNELMWLTLTFIFYGISYLNILYLMANNFKTMSSLFSTYFFVATVSCTLPIILCGSIETMRKYDDYIFFLSIVPDFNLNNQVRIIGENFFIHRRNSVLKDPIIVPTTFYNLFAGKESEDLNTTTFFFFTSLVVIASGIVLIFKSDKITLKEQFYRSCCCCNGKIDSTDSNDHQERVELQMETTTSNDLEIIPETQNLTLKVNELYKNYDNKIKAVRGISFNVSKRECFGLLGVNGAGKTSTFKMITGNEAATKGNIDIEDVNIEKKENLYKFLIGYCPQIDALNYFMTSYEILKYMAKLKIINNGDEVEREVDWCLQMLGLQKYRNIPIKYYSGGTKRKLNVAIALIGNPKVLFLDEPTTGVDPISRRFMWRCIQEFQLLDKTIVLTSHSMDECENLCNRIAIMCDGRFKKLGYISGLKHKFGKGYTIKFHLQDDSNINDAIQELNAVMETHFDGKANLEDHHAGVLTYFIKETYIKWSVVFGKIESALNTIKENNKIIIRDFSLNEPTLEDIFLSKSNND